MKSQIQNKKTLHQVVWNKKRAYYDTTTQAYKNIESHFAFRAIVKYLPHVRSVFEIGCGNGSVLANFKKVFPYIKMTGIDVSELAIKQGRKQYGRKISIRVADAESIRLHTKFDLVISFFTFEHLDNPEKVFLTMARHVKKKGYLYIVCPNYGSLIYPSPCYKKSLIERVGFSLQRDIHLLLNRSIASLDWQKVSPILDFSSKHIMDHDTTIEPYIFSLKRFVESNYPEYRVIFADSGWWSVPDASFLFKVGTLPFRLFDVFGIVPFRYWGPRCMLLLQKI